MKNKKKFHSFQKYPTLKHGAFRMEVKQLSVYTCVHEVQQISIVKLNCMPFHPAINSSITTHTCLSFSKLPSLHYRQPWSPGYPRYTGILVYSSHLQVLISQHLAHVSSGDTIYWTCDFQGDFRWGVLRH